MKYFQNKIIIDEVTVQKRRIDIKYSVTGKIKEYVMNTEPYFIEYSEDISKTPKSVAIIPFIANMLPVIWLLDAELIVDELDESFYNSIVWFKRGYIDMYPMIHFDGKLTVNKLINNNYKPSDKTITLFSGGADSNSTLVSHINEDLTLLTIWGADVYFWDTDGWDNLVKDTKTVAKEFNLTPVFAKSCFKNNLDYEKLNKSVRKSGDNWWHGFQHGLGLIGHFAPLAYKHKYKVCYIPTSPCVTDKRFETCASVPNIDEKVKFCGCGVIHDGYELNRQERIANVCQYATKHNKKFTLRVCFESIGGKNCGSCEKCLRTLFALLVEGENPADYGFDCDVRKASCVNELVEKVKKFPLPLILVACWQGIQEEYITRKEQLHAYKKQLEWLESWDFNKNYQLYLTQEKFKFLKKNYSLTFLKNKIFLKSLSKIAPYKPWRQKLRKLYREV